MKKIYVCSPYSGDTDLNIKNAIEYTRVVIDSGNAPIAPHLYITRVLDDAIPRDRESGTKIGIELLLVCDEIWVFGENISQGMRREIEVAEKEGIKIVRA